MSVKFEILFDGEGKALKIHAEHNSKFIIEVGSIISMDPVFDVNVKTGGLISMIGKSFSGESIFHQEIVAQGSGEMLIAPKCLGDIKIIEKDIGRDLMLGEKSFLAAGEDIKLDIGKKRRKQLLSGDGFFHTKVKGEGKIIVSSYGEILMKELGEGKKYIIDSGNLVAWDDGINFKSVVLGSVYESWKSDEGIVLEMSGKGRVWFRSRTLKGPVSGESVLPSALGIFELFT
ncbi:MAG: TIGR00266 family protein [Clostridium sp.]